MVDIKDFFVEDKESWNENLQDILTESIRSNPTELGFKHLANAHQLFQELLKAYFERRYVIDPEWRKGWAYKPNIDRIECEFDRIEIKCSTPACGCGCSGSDSRTFRFPLSDLWNQDEILEGVKLKIEADKQAKVAAEQKRVAAEALRREEEDMRQLKELAAKYPWVLPR
jgi:hypothetical protein